MSDDLADRVSELETTVKEQGELIEALRLKLNYQANRIDDLEGNGDGSERVKRDLDDLLPIDRWIVGRENGETLTANVERATYVWDAFDRHARRDRGRLRLTSDQVGNILARDPDGPQLDKVNRNTRVRVMEWVARGTGEADDPENEDNLVQLGGRDKKTLITEAHEYDRYKRGPDDSLSPETGQEEGPDIAAQADAEFERLEAAAVTDGGSHQDDTDTRG